jgi:hypothetical protein
MSERRLFRIYVQIFVLICLFCTLGCVKESKKIALELDKALERPLILGASISANHNEVESPGRLMAKDYGFLPAVQQIAKPGARGKNLLKEVTDEALKDRSILIGLDLLFWDSTEWMCGESLVELKTFLSRTENLKIPIVLGKIPRLRTVPAQPCQKTLNEALEDLCKLEKLCFPIPLDEIYSRISREGGAKIGEVFHPENQLLPDGLHLSTKGSELLSTKIQYYLNSGTLN